MPSQAPTIDQLIELSRLAVQHGLYDADDVIRRHVENQTEPLSYFILRIGTIFPVKSLIHQIEAQAKTRPARFRIRSFPHPDDREVVWTDSLRTQKLVRTLLIYLGIEFEETTTEPSFRSILG